ncbi:hypothetical protein P8452_44062 [Trifolium repens]|nr:hypothetical protein P8452_44062 [Trifolium repens]
MRRNGVSRNPQISSTSTPSSMDENIGRGRHGADHKLLKEAMRSIANGKKIMRKSEAVDMVTTYLGMAHADVETEFDGWIPILSPGMDY